MADFDVFCMLSIYREMLGFTFRSTQPTCRSEISYLRPVVLLSIFNESENL